MRTDDFDYHLPPELIAQSPIEPRDSSRLMVLNRDSGEIEHQQFPDLLEYLRPGDVMVFNQSRVIPARLYGHRTDTGSKAEFLLLRRNADGTWQAMARPGRRLRPGVVVAIEEQKSPQPPFTKGGLQYASGKDAMEDNPPPFDKAGTEGGFSVEIIAAHDDGLKTVRLSSEEGIERFGHTPLPPYIKESLDDIERYQTVYSRQPGSVAAPTAGLHFTDDLLQKARDLGVETVFVTLHVGLDTFKPVDEDDPTEHKIHTEHYSIDSQAAESLNKAKAEGRRIIAVGTTSVRVLEQAALDLEQGGKTELTETDAEASLFILPGHTFRLVDAMVTNFHLPRSSLLMLVSAFVEHGMGASGPSTGSGRAVVMRAYEEAIAQRYRFYSFGDATLII
ncbi:MAG: tRNA preQ1(34) S-adenosylmethionine ribosyltransferase-isomerase QueA [Chloroflexi bacterium]|nr:tRNA preQ1(34) S-adenosylmethionine ribosyltransferase-isomerase QueA [Chloroflexota bacterium]